MNNKSGIWASLIFELVLMTWSIYQAVLALRDGRWLGLAIYLVLTLAWGYMAYRIGRRLRPEKGAKDD